MKKRFLLLPSFVLFFGGCFYNDSPKPKLIKRVVTQKTYTVKPCSSKPDIVTLTVIGEGIAPKDAISPTQAMVLAKRAAIIDGYRQLGEKLYGIKLSAQERVEDAVLRNSKIATSLNAVIKNAAIINNAYKDGLYRVMMELKIDRNLLRSYLYTQN